jgi:hypothetical protein
MLDLPRPHAGDLRELRIRQHTLAQIVNKSGVESRFGQRLRARHVTSFDIAGNVQYDTHNDTYGSIPADT